MVELSHITCTNVQHLYFCYMDAVDFVKKVRVYLQVDYEQRCRKTLYPAYHFQILKKEVRKMWPEVSDEEFDYCIEQFEEQGIIEKNDGLSLHFAKSYIMPGASQSYFSKWAD